MFPSNINAPQNETQEYLGVRKHSALKMVQFTMASDKKSPDIQRSRKSSLSLGRNSFNQNGSRCYN